METKASEMAKTGSATYLTKIDGQSADIRGIFVLSGDSRFQASVTLERVVPANTQRAYRVHSTVRVDRNWPEHSWWGTALALDRHRLRCGAVVGQKN